MNDLIPAPEAALLVGKTKERVYEWIRLGYIEGVVVRTGRQKRGLINVSRSEVLKLNEFMRPGLRELPEGYSRNPDFVYPKRKPKKRKQEFEDWQLEVARRVFG